MGKKSKRVIVVAGGTGGHLFPAVLRAKKENKLKASVLFLFDQRAERFNLRERLSGIPCNNIFPIKTSSRVKFFAYLLPSILKVLWLFYKFKPNEVIAFGGYPTIPVMIVAVLLRVKLVLNEQNAIMGKANRMFAPVASEIEVNFPNTVMDKGYYKKTKVVPLLVNPKIKESTYYPKKFTILLIAGSLGSEYLVNLLLKVLSKIDNKKNVKVCIQVPENIYTKTKKNLSELGIEEEVETFFTDIMQQYNKASIIISRSGASAVRESLIVNKPTVFIPIPNSMHNHQYLNAKKAENMSKKVTVIEQKKHVEEDLLKALLINRKGSQSNE